MARVTTRAKAFWRRSTSITAKLVIYLICNALIFAVGIVFVVLGGTLAIAVGSSLIATGMAGAVLFVYVLMTERLAQQYELLSDFGVRSIYKGRSVSIRDEYESRLDNARQHIDLLGFGQKSFREDFGDRFEAWISNGVTLRVLLLHPTYPGSDWQIATQRDAEEMHASGDIARDVGAFLRETQELRARADKFQVRLYSCLPALNILRIDNELFWGPYLLRKPSRSSPTFLVGQGALYDVMLAHFEAIWTDPDLSSPAGDT